jgi:hypothetical protein
MNRKPQGAHGLGEGHRKSLSRLSILGLLCQSFKEVTSQACFILHLSPFPPRNQGEAA